MHITTVTESLKGLWIFNFKQKCLIGIPVAKLEKSDGQTDGQICLCSQLKMLRPKISEIAQKGDSF